jgi:hypothetical protein
MPGSYGHFGDDRLATTAEELITRAAAGRTLVLRALAGGRAGEMRYQRFLSSPQVTTDELLANVGAHTASACAGARVLAIQDTTEVSFGRARVAPSELGAGTDDQSPALFLHPVLAVDRDRQAVVGPVYGEIWTRAQHDVARSRGQRAYADKESQRWLTAMQASAERLQQARQVIMVADREADIFTPFAKRPAGLDLVVRARHNRPLADGGKLFQAPEAWAELGRQWVSVAPRGPGDKGRWAQVELRAGPVEVARPHTAAPDTAATVRLTLVRVVEPAPPEGKQGLCWHLLTTLPVASLADAVEVAGIYRQRWRIEQLFRSMKSDGLGLEDSQLVRPEHLFKLTAIALVAASRTMQLVDARDGSERPASDLLDPDLHPAAAAIGRRLEGRTARQQNPYPYGSLAWLSWIVARLGGWNCYYKPPGPKTMRRGWDKLAERLNGYLQALDELDQANA